MKQFILISLLAFLGIVSCSVSSLKSKNDFFHSTKQPIFKCFISIAGKDTSWLKLSFFPDSVVGTFYIQPYETDYYEGTLKGKMDGNILRADYTFYTEDFKTVNAVAFQLSDSVAVQGIGELIEKSDGHYEFKNNKAIDFSNGPHFKLIDCSNNKSQFE